MKIFDRLAKRFPTAILPVACTLALGACDKEPVDWRGNALTVAMPASGDEGSVPVDAHLVLRPDGSLALEPKHGWAIGRRIQQVSKDALQVTQGSLYPALHRLEQQGWIKAQPGVTPTGRSAKFYALTAAGRKQLARELENWDRL